MDPTTNYFGLGRDEPEILLGPDSYLLQDFGIDPNIEERGQVFCGFLWGRVLQRQFLLKAFRGQVLRGYLENSGNYGSAMPLRRKHRIAINCVDYKDGSFPLDYAK